LFKHQSLCPHPFPQSDPFSISEFGFNLSSILGVNNQAEVYFRVIDDSTTAINGSPYVPGGDDRIDNFMISAQVVPEPATLTLSGMAVVGGVLLQAWRRKRPLQ
jgi:hypothetical protein